jgi:hypothetical protein
VVFLTDFQLLHISFRGVKENPVHEAIGPEHLHLDDELAFFLVHAARINDVFAHLRRFWNQVTWETLQFLDLSVRLQRQQRVEKALADQKPS